MLRNLLTASLLATGLTAASGLALAQPTEGGWHHEGMELLQGLNLTDAQQGQIRQLMQSAHAQMKSTGEQMRSLHEQMASGVLSGSTVEQLAPVLQQEEALRSQVDNERLTVAIQVRNLLTPEQLAQASATHTKLVALHQQEHELTNHTDQ